MIAVQDRRRNCSSSHVTFGIIVGSGFAVTYDWTIVTYICWR